MKEGKVRNPIAWVPSVYFAMGMPFVALSLVSVIMFKDLGIDEASITLWTSLIILPYSLKPIWSPLLEIWGTKKGVVVITQMLSGLCFGFIAFMLPIPNFFAFTIAMMGVIAFSGATHDIATDGIYLTSLDKDTQARYIGWQGAFFNLAKVLANGGMVGLAGILMDHFKETEPEKAAMYAWMIIMGLIAILLCALSIYHYFVLPKGAKSTDAPTSAYRAMVSFAEVFKAFFQKKYIWIFILFIVSYRLTEGFAVKMVPLFLKASLEEGGLALSNGQIGLIYGTLGTIAFIIGSIAGGYYIAAGKLKRVLFSLICIFNIPFVIYYLFALFQPANIYLIGSGLVLEYFCYGFGFVGLTMFMMEQVAPGKHTMAHYAFASGIMNLGFMIPGMISGWIFQQVGYEQFFFIALVVSIPAFIMAWVVPFDNAQLSKIKMLCSKIIGAVVVGAVIFVIYLLLNPTNANMSGRITAESTNENLKEINVRVVGTTFSTTTNEEGCYSFENLPVGEFNVEVTKENYATQTLKVNIVEDSTYVLNFVLEELSEAEPLKEASENIEPVLNEQKEEVSDTTSKNDSTPPPLLTN